MINFINNDKKITKEGCFNGTDIPFVIESRNDSGELHGEVVWNYENGTPKRIMQYDNGVVISSKWYYNDGVEKLPNDKGCGCIVSISEGNNTTGRVAS